MIRSWFRRACSRRRLASYERPLTARFAEDYQHETPAHPARGFRGRAQVRQNWEQIFAFVPDIHVEVVRSAIKSDNVWTEWEMRGTRRDGKPYWSRGVVVFGVNDDAIRW